LKDNGAEPNMDNEIYKGWLHFYKRVHTIKSPVQYDARRVRRLPLSEGVFEEYINSVTELTTKSDVYLDSYGYRMPQPLWHYDPKDKTTWASHESFAYGHLL